MTLSHLFCTEGEGLILFRSALVLGVVVDALRAYPTCILLQAREEELRIWFLYHDGRRPKVSFVVPPSPSGYGGLQLEGSDEVDIPMYQIGADKVKIPIDVTHSNTYVKKWAIDLIYEADEIHKGNDTWCQVVHNIQL
ncbi:hypothetical protein RHMOL_Rhmol01G0082500 [Rhododendron molle]|uniref:Uncharacterized protein n=1 Tax=Rhododendron molle TaxID=49168 RepID=A0ACC0PZU6_RHOML|nr:hypothetical protein RHMOL_Rhmol01G0082500 [Rhododendron molle]